MRIFSPYCTLETSLTVQVNFVFQVNNAQKEMATLMSKIGNLELEKKNLESKCQRQQTEIKLLKVQNAFLKAQVQTKLRCPPPSPMRSFSEPGDSSSLPCGHFCNGVRKSPLREETPEAADKVSCVFAAVPSVAPRQFGNLEYSVT